MINKNKIYNLEERTAVMGIDTIKMCKNIKHDIIINPLISQLIRSATSVGANYMEANSASSKRDFVNKIFICKKESQETMHWLRMISECCPEKSKEISQLRQEMHELILIFGRIIATIKNRVNSKLQNQN
ncbi:MAG: four helix bundle protein [Patescibacteria group bacterium]|nr:four helix bundle protein [Patescibacteria group bacterium]